MFGCFEDWLRFTKADSVPSGWNLGVSSYRQSGLLGDFLQDVQMGLAPSHRWKEGEIRMEILDGR